ncbi:MAG: DeoR/GlpR transcriptional regulator, partial [Candidatus Lokiarchaeota archaeon]|nr:DeoR/GlpR transcriptional regulator [Candidatus Lokiarchaeota archaeon]
MIAEKRRAKIIEIVNGQGSASIEELLELFDVSRMTIWRDLKELEIKGQ